MYKKITQYTKLLDWNSVKTKEIEFEWDMLLSETKNNWDFN